MSDWRQIANAVEAIGAPQIGRMLAGPAGERVGIAVAAVLSDIVGADATPTAVEDAATSPADQAMVSARLQDPAIISALSAVEREALLAMADKDKAQGWFAYAWRPGWMYLLAILWIWTIVLAPALSGLTALTFQLVDASTLLTLTGAYLGLYMGGNTIIRAVAKSG
ncbi:hypothetical protein LUX29_11940 [Aureimonas altamirensis]|uniref:3TM-type holin n=1 Tax=Aureimonas altamirensis TaxID=370622 RepID=UPI001E3AC4C8|nr:hypothetical protein [Aureimonas altamirensis]UHD43813.1 hypothetical protein LUX29_11940 [Aureimonas altamirensis]